MLNERQRQTYYGSVDVVSAEFYLQAYPKGNSTYMVEYLKYLVSLHPKSKLLLIWDKASYHTSKKVREFLTQINGDVPEAERKIQIEWLPTASPQLNPVEDIWLKGKTFLRRNSLEFNTFAQVKNAFVEHLNTADLFFNKLLSFGSFIPQMI